jgi:hypothetical protein
MNLNYRFGLLLIMTLCALSPLSAQGPAGRTRPLFSPAEPSVSCGMTILPGRRSVDPKMAKTPPPGEFTLQARRPDVCRDMSRLPALKDLKDLPNRLPMFLGPKQK